MRIVRRPLPGDLQSRYWQVSGCIEIDPAKVPPCGEDDVIAQSLLHASGRPDLAPYAARAAPARHLSVVPDLLPPVADDDAGAVLVDGVG